MTKKIGESSLRKKKLEEEIRSLATTLNTKQMDYDKIRNKTISLRDGFDIKSKKVQEIEEKLEKLHQKSITLKSQYLEYQSRISVNSQKIDEISSRKEYLTNSYSRLNESLRHLQDIHKEQSERLKVLKDVLKRKTAQNRFFENEMRDAGKIVEIAREAVIEFAAQREIIKRIESEKTAVESIEELGETDVIPGVYGRLRNLIKVKKKYKQAAEAAASGWLEAIVVQDQDAAFTCNETQRRLELGRVKIIPIEMILHPNKEIPRMNDIVGS